MKELFSLGEIYPSDFLKPDETPHTDKIELKLLMDDDGVVRLEKTAPLNKMFGRYFYRSGTNNSMKVELKNIVNSILEVKKLNDNDVWVDIASNDGTLLSNVPKNLIRIGIDPADDTYKVESEKHSNVIVQDFFSAKNYKSTEYGERKASVITSIAMFYDLEDPDTFTKDIFEILDDNGLWVLQLSYSPLMISQLAFDNILHEHTCYYSLFNLKKILNRNGFQIVDCSLNNTNAGSFRVYAMKSQADLKTFTTQTHRDVCDVRVKSLLAYEKSLKLDQVETWKEFYSNILLLKEQVVSFLEKETSEGKVIYGYGASTKFNTLLQFFDIGKYIKVIAERTPYKFGLKTVGTNIPIISEEQMRQDAIDGKVDYLFVGPWQFLSEFVEREKDTLALGVKMIFPCPKFEVIG
tara:strand:- start:14488 stop:15711 length:1224 start_codon:yes stop_codon:yes gene_type:complete